MSEPYNYRPAAPPQPGRPQGWAGTSKLPMQALGAPPQDLQSTSYGPYQPQQPQRGRRPGGGPGGFFRDRGKLVDFTLKGLGLLGVALVSGFLWYLIRNDPATPSQAGGNQQTQTTGVYSFQTFQAPSTVDDCAAHATERVRTYLQQHPCTSLTRSLYTAYLAGNKVITSVAVVKMDTMTAARGLKAISDGNGTGHVKDLVEEGTVIPSGPTSLQDAGYFSKIKGTDVVIIMTEYVNQAMDSQGNLQANDSTLKSVSSDAAKQNIGAG